MSDPLLSRDADTEFEDLKSSLLDYACSPPTIEDPLGPAMATLVAMLTGEEASALRAFAQTVHIQNDGPIHYQCSGFSPLEGSSQLEIKATSWTSGQLIGSHHIQSRGQETLVGTQSLRDMFTSQIKSAIGSMREGQPGIDAVFWERKMQHKVPEIIDQLSRGPNPLRLEQVAANSHLFNIETKVTKHPTDEYGYNVQFDISRCDGNQPNIWTVQTELLAPPGTQPSLPVDEWELASATESDEQNPFDPVLSDNEGVSEDSGYDSGPGT